LPNFEALSVLGEYCLNNKKAFKLIYLRYCQKILFPFNAKEIMVYENCKSLIVMEFVEKFLFMRIKLTFIDQGEWEKAIELFTNAIKLNPNSAAMFAKRGTCFLKLNKPRACVRDCTR